MKKVKVLVITVLTTVILFALALSLQNPASAATATGTPAPLLSGASIVPGGIPGSTRVTGVTYGTGDHFVYQIVTKVTVTPSIGAAFPAAAIYYEMGSNITGVDATSKKFVDVYEVDAFGKIVKFQEFPVSLLPPAPALSVTVAKGSASGTTKITATAGSGNTLAYQVVKKPTTKIPLTGAFLPAGSQAYTSGNDISAVDLTTNKYVDIYAISVSGQIVSFTEVTLQSGNILAPALTKKPVVVKSAAANGSKLTLTPNKAGDTFQTILTILDPGQHNPSEVPIPAIGDSMPVFDTSNIFEPLPMFVIRGPELLAKTGELTGVSPGIVVNIYELDKSSKIVSYTMIQLAEADVSLPTLNTAPTVTASTYAGAAAVTATVNMPGVGTIPSDKFVYKLVSTPTKAQPGYGTALPSGVDLNANKLNSGSPTDVLGADPKTYKYIDIYEYSDWLDTIIVYGFKEIALDTTSIRANAANAVATPGKTAGTTKLTVTPAKTGNTFMTFIGISPATPPTVGIAAPKGATAYAAGKDLKITDVATTKYLGVYEMSAGKVYGFKEIVLTGADVTAPTLTAVAAAGSESSTTKVTATAGSGHTISIKVVSSPTALPAVGSDLPAGTTDSYVTGTNFSGTNASSSKYVDVYEVDSAKKVVSFKEIIVTAAQIKR